MQNVAHILKGVLINYLVIEGGFPSEILSIYGNIRCFFEILKMLICNFLADPAQCGTDGHTDIRTEKKSDS